MWIECWQGRRLLRAAVRCDAQGRLQIAYNGQTVTCAPAAPHSSVSAAASSVPAAAVSSEAGVVCAPIAGRIVACPGEAGKSYPAGTEILVIEAMKMEYSIALPELGQLQALSVGVGEAVAAGAELFRWQALPASAQARAGSSTAAGALVLEG